MAASKGTSALYVLLGIWIVLSLGDYIVGAAALREEFFHSSKYARLGFELGEDGVSVSNPRKEAKSAGLASGDRVQTVNGQRFTGEEQAKRLARASAPGQPFRVTVQTGKGQIKTVEWRLAPRDSPGFALAGLIAFLVPVLGVPLIGLAVGYWVVAARPHDPNAWLVLFLLTFTQTAFGNLDYSFWGGASLVVFGVFSFTIQAFVFVALLWFGIYFPERWRADVKWPFMKWILLALSCFNYGVVLCFLYGQEFNVAVLPPLMPAFKLSERLSSWTQSACIILFLIALVDKWRSVSTADGRRRLRVLALGSALSLGPTLLIFIVTPFFGIDVRHGNWFMILVPLIALFPLTLAYVVIVQRAMDIRILLRMGTRYLLAKATISVLQVALVLFVLFRLIMPLFQGRQHAIWEWLLALGGAALLVRWLLMRDSLWVRLQRMVDRKFFREAYNTEQVLTELSEQTRRYTEKGPLIETVCGRLSEVLHVREIAVWLRGGGVFQLQLSSGLQLDAVVLAEGSNTVQNLTRTNKPATLYEDRPEEWFEQAADQEKALLRSVHAELLLPLPGRDRLMGLITLGPKRSEEPYTPTDLRILQSVATQTGLALEVTDLAESLAAEAARRARVDREIEIAREVQERLFPQAFPDVPGLSLAGMCRPALGVGGDYYDLIHLEDGRLGIAIGDVSGKGISAALLMASLRASLRGMALETPSDLARLMQKVNLLVYEASASNRYATFFFSVFDPRTNDLRYVNAGHNPPMLIRCRTGEVERLDAGGVVVGLLPFAAYEEQRVALEPGDLLITYTDGISEAMTQGEEEWGEDRLLAAAQTVAGQHAAAVLQTVFAEADKFTDGAPQHDDMTLLVLALHPIPVNLESSRGAGDLDQMQGVR